MHKLKIYNEFGIVPTTTYTAAGLDFYIPNLVSPGLNDVGKVWNELAFSYKTDAQTLQAIGDILVKKVLEKSNTLSEKFVYSNILNLVHLYCAIDTGLYEDDKHQNRKYDLNYSVPDPYGVYYDFNDFIKYFMNHVLIIPENESKPFGIMAQLNDSVFFNSGIRVALPENTAGVFMNKSGKGNAGWDVRSQVVDEDYTGLVHLSLAYTKENYQGSQLYIGDKITQMLVLPIYQVSEVECLTKYEYDDIMKNSQRGNNAFGSSDVKH